MMYIVPMYIYIYIAFRTYNVFMCIYEWGYFPGELTQTKQTLYNQNVSISMHTQYIYLTW